MLNGGTSRGLEGGYTRFTYERCRATQGGFQVNGFIDSASFKQMESGASSTGSRDCYDGGSAAKDYAATSVLRNCLHCQKEGL